MVSTPRTQSQPDLFSDVADPQAHAAQRERCALQTAQVAPPPTTTTTALAPSREPVWVCLYFPGLPLQALRAQCSTTQPAVVVEGDRQRTVIAINRVARQFGLMPGQSLRTAMALCQDVQILERAPEQEQALLAELAEHLIAFSPQVCLQPPQAVLLELRGSLRLFQGIDNLLARLLSQCLPDHHVRFAVAPTPTSAYWLVRGGLSPDPQTIVKQGAASTEFQQLLNALDLSVTDWSEAAISALREMGIYTIGDCRRLPRAGLARRFGVSVPQGLAKALGELPDLRDVLVAPPRFDAIRQLDAEIADAAALQPVCELLLRQLETDLRSRQAAVREIAFHFHAWRGHSGHLTLSLCAPGYRLSDWLPVLEAQLERLELMQPVVAVSLGAHANDALTASTAALDLTSDIQCAATSVEAGGYALLDRLRARLGETAIAQLTHVAEHRPEYASQTITLADTKAPVPEVLPRDWQIRDVPLSERDDGALSSVWLQRPLWLLDSPQPLSISDNRPCHQGVLVLNHGPERISSGWWEQRPSVRDYFVATDIDAARLWVFRTWTEDHEPQWWLHGIFG